MKINKEEKIEELKPLIPDLPAGFFEWTRADVMWEKLPMLYHRHGRYADIKCMNCGHEETICTKLKDSYEGQFEKIFPVPQNGNETTCLKCGKKLMYKPFGRFKKKEEKDDAYIIQQLTDNSGIIIRWFIVYRSYTRETPVEYEYTEIGRQYNIMGVNAVLREYQYHNYYLGHDFWSVVNRGGINPISFPYASVYPGSYEELDKSDFKYCCLDKWIYRKGIPIKCQITSYIAAYQKYPILEMLMKNRMYELAEHIVWGMVKGMKSYQKDPIKALGIYKYRLKTLLNAKNESSTILGWLQYEKKTGQRFKDDTIIWFCQYCISPDDIRFIQGRMTLEQIRNYLTREHQICGRGIKNILITWSDYMNMASKLKMNLDDAIVYRPKSIVERHDALVMELNRKDIEKAAQEYMERFPQIQKNIDNIKRRYFYEDDDYIIRAPEDVTEILQESRALHHCVATSDRYFDRMNRKETYILFMRKKTNPKVPYYTLEVEPNGNIRQRRSEYNRQPDLEMLTPTLIQWQKMIRANMTAKDRALQKKSDELREINMKELYKNSPEFARTLDEDYMEYVEDHEEMWIPQELLDAYKVTA